MSAKYSIRSSVSSSSKARLSSCAFTFADGRRCRALPLSGHSPFCHFHARREAQARAAEQLGRDAGFFLSGGYVSACDLSAALGRLFAQAAAGNVKPRTTATLTYLAQVLVQTIRLAENEYIASFGSDAWRSIVSSHAKENAHYLNPHAASPAPSSPSPVPIAKASHPMKACVEPSRTTATPACPERSRGERAQRVEAPEIPPAPPNPPVKEPQPTRPGEPARPGPSATAAPPPTTPEKLPAKSKSSSTPTQAEPPKNPPPSTDQESPRAYVDVGPCRLPMTASVPITWPWPPKPNSM